MRAPVFVWQSLAPNLTTRTSGPYLFGMSDPLRDRLATALGPTYELQRLLGKGGMGSVYLARETALDRLVAVKVLPPEVTGDPETRERFRREARTAAKLTHPHIVPLYSFGEADGLLWFVMGYVAGETLAAKLERTPRMDPDLVRRVLGDVADALDYAHQHGIVHRDVKPENILIEDAGGKALLADFGVARQGTGSTTLTTAGALVGTPLYMSPEQASGERDLDGRSDIYSLGVVGYRMLAGRVPFEGSELRAVLAAHITQPAPALPASIPEDLNRVLMRALSKKPAERWGSGQELRSALGTAEVISSDEIDRLGGLPSFAAHVFLLGWAGLAAWMLLTADGQSSEWTDMIPAFFGLMWLVLPLVAWDATRKGGVTFGKALQIACWPPSWWGTAWPLQLRRPGDVWQRLPRLVRRLRVAAGGALLAAIAVLALAIREQLLGPGHQNHADRLLLLLAPVIWAQLGGLLWLTRFGKKLGLDAETSTRLIGKPTWNDPFWKKPEIARLLTPVGVPHTRVEEPSTPAEVAMGVRRVAATLPSHHSALAKEATERAEAIAKRIATMDAELAALARDFRQDDVTVIERRIADLGPERTDEPAARREIRQMHQQQLKVLQRLQQQVVDGQARREHLAGLLRTLYLQVSELNVESKRLTEADTSGVREIVDRMAREVEGLREVGG